MADTIGMNGPARTAAGDGGRPVPRVAAPGGEGTPDRPQRGNRTAEADPPSGQRSAMAPLDAHALNEARAAIADALGMTDAAPGPAAVPIPLAPDASADAVADAQALARLIAANAHPALRIQARLRPDAVMTVIGPDAA